eukprot:1382668-Lingulodinium_polyedra.AAC.1
MRRSSPLAPTKVAWGPGSASPRNVLGAQSPASSMKPWRRPPPQVWRCAPRGPTALDVTEPSC